MCQVGHTGPLYAIHKAQRKPAHFRSCSHSTEPLLGAMGKFFPSALHFAEVLSDAVLLPETLLEPVKQCRHVLASEDVPASDV